MRNDRRRRSLRMEALERREVLAAAVVSFALFDDNNGTPGEPLAHVEENQSFFLELSAEETHELYQGLGAVSVSLKWDPQRLALDPEFDPNVAITNALPFHHAKVDAEAGRIDDLSGALFFNSGQPIGDAGPERFALLRFQAQDIAGPAGLSLAEGPSGTVLYPMGSPTMFFDRQDILIVEPGFIDEPGGQINDDLVIFVDPPYVSDIVVEDQNIVDQGKADRQPPPAPLADQSKADELAPKTDELAPKTDELAPKAEEALAATSVAKAALAPPPLPSRPGATATPPGAVAPITALPGNDDSTIDNSTNDNSTNDAPGAEKPPVETPSDELQPSERAPDRDSLGRPAVETHGARGGHSAPNRDPFASRNDPAPLRTRRWRRLGGVPAARFALGAGDLLRAVGGLGCGFVGGQRDHRLGRTPHAGMGSPSAAGRTAVSPRPGGCERPGLASRDRIRTAGPPGRRTSGRRHDPPGRSPGGLPTAGRLARPNRPGRRDLAVSSPGGLRTASTAPGPTDKYDSGDRGRRP